MGIPVTTFHKLPCDSHTARIGAPDSLHTQRRPRTKNACASFALAALFAVGEGSATERSAKDKTILRALKTAGAAGRAENQGDEERAFNFDFLTKLKNMQKILPGTQAYKQAAALKKAAAAAEMAERKKIINAALQSDDYLYGFFNAMVSGLQSRQNVREYVLSAGKSDDLATQISNRYYNYAQTAQAGKKT